MTAGLSSDNVRYWTLEESLAELERVEREMKLRGKTPKEFSYRAAEWELTPEEFDLLRQYERLDRMVRFARGGSHE